MHGVLWQSVLGEIELSVSHGNFETWFKHTDLLELQDNRAVIGVANIFAKRQFEVKFDKQIREILKQNGVDVEIISYQVKTAKKRIISRETTGESSEEKVGALLPSRRTSTTTNITASTTLNPKYTFDSFIVGSSNDLAYTACQAAAAFPGTNSRSPILVRRLLSKSS